MTDEAGPGRPALPPGAREVGLRTAEGVTATVLVAGDLCVRGPADPEPHPWEPLRAFVAAHDLSLVGLECPLTTRATQIAKLGPTLAGDPGLARLAVAGGFDAATLANNHIMDRGPGGLEDTLSACAGAGLATVGAGADLSAASRPLAREAGGLRLAVLSVAEREFSIAGAAAPGAAPLDPWVTPAQVRELRSGGALVVVVLHGGNEHYPLPRPGLVAACRALADAGASAVVCHHSHTAGPWEVHGGVPIFYGAGNFLFPPRRPQPAAWRQGYLVSLTLDAGGACGFRLVGCEQPERAVAVRPLGAVAAAAWFARLDELGAVVADPVRLAAAWAVFCRRRRPYALASALGLTRVERRLLKAGVWPFWRLPRRRLPDVYDMVACDSHREVLESLLEEEIGS